MKKVRGIYARGGLLYVRFQDEHGKIVRESTGQNSLRVAEQILAKRRAEVAMRTHFPTRRFEAVKFGSLLDKWWQDHGRHRRSGFEYLLPRIRERFAQKRAREINQMSSKRFCRNCRG